MTRIEKADISPTMIKLLLTYGREYKLTHLPREVPRGPLGECFKNCADVAILSDMFNEDGSPALLYSKPYRYVEGIALELKQGKNPKMVYHAWLTDGKRAIDPTYYQNAWDGY